MNNEDLNAEKQLRRELREIVDKIHIIQLDLTRINVQLNTVISELSGLKSEVHADFVTRESYNPIKNFVYGTVAVIATGFITALFVLLRWGN